MSDLKSLVRHNNNPLLEIIYNAHYNYCLWWKLRGPERPKFIETMRRYILFFHTSIKSYFLTLIVSLYKLYDSNSKTNNFNKLLNLAKNECTFSKEELIQLEEKFNKARVIWEKVVILRSNYFAHLNIKFDEKNLYKQANITPNELGELIYISLEFFNLIREHYGEGKLGLINIEPDIKKLFKDLDVGFTQNVNQ
ncbi:MAG: hypothetical protein ISS80_00365 [Candidatus Cloacimonetes bacterium]|nr:hypothetical protein [Candidatus Cloacimonadota bacterium]MBL7148507.1 hypothetical protein [Candidatus Cloacimonadota bacterium]